MPLEIVRNNIADMCADAIVNTANPRPVIGSGVDSEIHKKAGKGLLEERKKIGNINRGEAAVTGAFGLDADIVIHTVGPVWIDGKHGEEDTLRSCYEKSLMLAVEHGCESIAFPLISAGNYGFPKALALSTAISTIGGFLIENEITVYLVVFERTAYELSEKLFSSVKSYIDDNYIEEKLLSEYEPSIDFAVFERFEAVKGIVMPCRGRMHEDDCLTKEDSFENGLEAMLKDTDDSFSRALLKMIDKTGKKDSEIYKRANVDRKLFSKIRNNPDYKPSKSTALAFAVALELSLEETKELIGRAGYALTHSSKADIITEYFIMNKKYDIFELNEVLFAFDQPLIGL